MKESGYFERTEKNEKRGFSVEETAGYSWRRDAGGGFHAAERYFLFMRIVNAYRSSEAKALGQYL